MAYRPQLGYHDYTLRVSADASAHSRLLCAALIRACPDHAGADRVTPETAGRTRSVRSGDGAACLLRNKLHLLADLAACNGQGGGETALSEDLLENL